MLYFDPQPNYQRIGKYFSWPGTPEQMQEANPHGYLIAIDWWQTKEDILRIENGFITICERYDLTALYDDLLLLFLLKYQQINAIVDELEENYKRTLRVKELASLILLVKQTKADKFKSLSIATPFDSVKIHDPALINWISNDIIKTIENKSYLVSLFGLIAEDMLIDKSNGDYKVTIEKLELASKAFIEPSPKINEQKADFCLNAHKFIITESNIKPDPNVWFSDNLLKFYFEVLVLFGYVNESSIGSEPKDYIRSILWQRLKKLNPSLTGK